LLKLRPFAARRKHEDTVAQFPENDGVDCEIGFVSHQPSQYFGIRGRLGRLAEHVRIHEVGHPNGGTLMSSVGSVKPVGLTLPRLNVVLLPDFGAQNDLAFA
jgi:hypothetical protein